MSLFGNKKQISRRDFREKLRKSSPSIPGSRRAYSEKDRVEIEKNVFGSNYGSYISKSEYRNAIRGLGRKKYEAKNSEEKFKIDREIRYLEKLDDNN